MKFDRRSDTYTLNSGRRIYANGGILGLRADTKTAPLLTEGYDGHVYADGAQPNDLDDEKPLTQREKEEIAAEMIYRWGEWAGLA